MRFQLPSRELQRLLPSCPGTAVHCRRVAALSHEIALRLPISWRSMASLEQAALTHHSELAEADRVPAELAAIREAFDGAVRAEPRVQRVADTLTLADWVDGQLEGRNWELRPMSECWDELAELAGMIDPSVWRAGQEALRAPYRDKVVPWDLPLHAPVVREVLVSLRENPDCDVRHLANLAEQDPVLAGNVLATANSAWFGRRTRVKSVSQAMAYIGANAGRRILFALALKPLFESARLAAVWRHSIEIAGFCESLARETGFLPAGEALTLGLIHDIGRVALVRHSASANSTFSRVVQRGMASLAAEELLFGQGHDEIGASILERWDFPPETIAAVRAHHHPADCDSLPAFALYLAEFWSESDEDLPSARHLKAAQHRLGCSLELLMRIGHAAHPLADLLRAA